jgi:hypothetical protein
VPVPSQEHQQSCISVLEVSILPLSAIFLLDFGTVLTVFHFFFHFFLLFVIRVIVVDEKLFKLSIPRHVNYI